MKIYLADHEFEHFKLGGAKRILMSFYHYQNDSIERLLKVLHPGVEVFADSGAFSADAKGTPINIDSYIKWVHNNKDSFEVYSNLDVIYNQKQTRENQRIMEEAELTPLPVFHIGSSFAEFRRICEEYDYIAIGGMVPYMKQAGKVMGVISKIFEIADGKKLHGFGCTNWGVLSRFPWYTADSSTWISGRRFGEVPIFTDKLFRLRFGDWKKWRIHRRTVENLGFDWKIMCDSAGKNMEYLLKFSVATFEEVEKALTKKHGDTIH